ncbi:MAG: hypothetical protein WBE97_15060 [Candidatus Acidiferrales bacterium]
MRYIFVSILILCALGAQTLPQRVLVLVHPVTVKRQTPCKTPENASTCYWTHGRLSVFNGSPSWRLWRIGTKRILGIYSGPSTFNYAGIAAGDGDHPEFPPNLEKIFEADVKHQMIVNDPFRGLPDSAFGDFEICPLDHKPKGWMEHACIESAKNIVLQPYVSRWY